MRTGLVLGAGGLVGQAYHAGVLAALEHDLGWDPRTADVIVGTSAGSVTGALLRLGVPAHDLSAWAVDAPLSVESQETFARLSIMRRPKFPGRAARDWLSGWRLPPADLVRRFVRRPWTVRLSTLASTMAPAGQVDLAEYVEAVDTLEAWRGGLWVCAARRDDGERVIFGNGGTPRASLAEAVAASCAIPGYFCPVVVGGVEYFDGGVHSSTNADVLADRDLDLVIVIAPMSAAGGAAAGVDRFIRQPVHRRLEREVRRLRNQGCTVVRIEPSRDVLDAMGLNMMARDGADRVVQEAFIDTGRYAGSARIATRLAPLASRGLANVGA